MPFIAVIPIIIIAAAYILMKKIKIKARVKEYLKLSICIITWSGIVYQFISIARYIDKSGEMISNVMGKGGLYISWTVLILFSVYLAAVCIETFSRSSE